MDIPTMWADVGPSRDDSRGPGLTGPATGSSGGVDAAVRRAIASLTPEEAAAEDRFSLPPETMSAAFRLIQLLSGKDGPG